jgi:hypothetical protein
MSKPLISREAAERREAAQKANVTKLKKRAGAAGY